MKITAFVALIFSFASAFLTCSAAAPGWKLAWNDEFNGKAGAFPNASKWTYDVGGNGWGNQELEVYCSPASDKAPCDAKVPNAYQDGRGHLIIQAVKGQSDAWTSARLKTIGLEQLKYGRVEARMQLPYGDGLWPAFWLLGTDITSAGWPNCGELDIMEDVPDKVPGGLGPDTIKSTIHGPGYSGGAGVGQPVRLPNGERVDTGYHVYGMVWSPDSVAFYVDDWRKPHFTADRKSIPQGAPWVFDKPFFMIMNLAVGGAWPKDPSPQTPNPAVMKVDYVRVYQRGS